MAEKLKVGIYGLTGCGGDQLTILNCEDELLEIAAAMDLVSFLMAKSDNQEGALDLALVEGSVSTKDNEDLVQDVRSRSKTLVTIGSCSCFGGPQAMKAGDGAWNERMEKIYGPSRPHPTEPMEARPVSAVVKVDYRIPGCPISKGQFLQTLSRILRGASPDQPVLPVCVECKFRENECLLLKGLPCLGPVTAAGCGAVCPSYSVPCIACFGPVDEANVAAEYGLLLEKGFAKEEIVRRMRSYGGVAAQELISGLPEIPIKPIAKREPPEPKPGERFESGQERTAEQDSEGEAKQEEEIPRGRGILRRRNRKR